MKMLKISNVEKLHIVSLIKLSHRYINGNLSKQLLAKLFHTYSTRQNKYPSIRVHSVTKFNNSFLVKVESITKNIRTFAKHAEMQLLQCPKLCAMVKKGADAIITGQ